MKEILSSEPFSSVASFYRGRKKLESKKTLTGAEWSENWSRGYDVFDSLSFISFQNKCVCKFGCVWTAGKWESTLTVRSSVPTRCDSFQTGHNWAVWKFAVFFSETTLLSASTPGNQTNVCPCFQSPQRQKTRVWVSYKGNQRSKSSFYLPASSLSRYFAASLAP